jgi:hypothetical protein
MQLCILKGVTAMVAHDEHATTYNLLAVVAEALHTWIGTLHTDIAKLTK